MMTPSGWSCKSCFALTYPGGVTLLRHFDRVCRNCRAASQPVPTKAVGVADLVVEIRRLVPWLTSSFHLRPCLQCLWPSWQYPCHWCGFAANPVGRKRPTPKPMGFQKWEATLSRSHFVLEYLSSRFASGNPELNNCWLDVALRNASHVSWPGRAAIWDAFGEGTSESERRLLHPSSLPPRKRLELEIEETYGEWVYFKWRGEKRGEDALTRLRLLSKEWVRLLNVDDQTELRLICQDPHGSELMGKKCAELGCGEAFQRAAVALARHHHGLPQLPL